MCVCVAFVRETKSGERKRESGDRQIKTFRIEIAETEEEIEKTATVRVGRTYLYYI